MIDLRCSTKTEDDTHRCQLLAGHGRVHAALVSIDGHRRILTWTLTAASSSVADLPADSATASRFAWSVGCPTIEEPIAESGRRRRRHLRVVA